jgi:dTDP-4-dehydrorhamnose 3,5-epimerase
MDVKPRRERLALDGVDLWRLEGHADERGSFTEMYRGEWSAGIEPVQWNVVRSAAGALRGVHVHVRHTDYLVFVAGRMRVRLKDLRVESSSAGQSLVLDFDGPSPGALLVPPGVAHGFYFLAESVHVYAVSAYWNPDEEMGCHYADPDLGVDWGLVGPPLLSPRDAALPPLNDLLERYSRWREPA